MCFSAPQIRLQSTTVLDISFYYCIVLYCIVSVSAAVSFILLMYNYVILHGTMLSVNISIINEHDDDDDDDNDDRRMSQNSQSICLSVRLSLSASVCVCATAQRTFY